MKIIDIQTFLMRAGMPDSGGWRARDFRAREQRAVWLQSDRPRRTDDFV